VTNPRIEYGAQVVSVAATVYMKDFSLSVVTDWIETMDAVTPIRLVTRVWDGEMHGGWELLVPTTTRVIHLPIEECA
jgi:hypothetical protein